MVQKRAQRAPSSTVQYPAGQEKTWSSSSKEVGGVGGGEGFGDGKVISRAEEAEVRSGSPQGSTERKRSVIHTRQAKMAAGWPPSRPSLPGLVQGSQIVGYKQVPKPRMDAPLGNSGWDCVCR